MKAWRFIGMMVFGGIFLLSCREKQLLDLQAYGINATLLCEPPDSISQSDLIVVKEIGLHWGGFEIMILQLLDERHAIDSFCTVQRSKIESLNNFHQFHFESDQGFVYHLKEDKGSNRYGFRYCNERILIKEHNEPYDSKRHAKRGLQMAKSFTFNESQPQNTPSAAGTQN